MVNLKEFRKANKLRQSDIADLIGITPGAVSQWENGLTSIPSDALLALLHNNKGWDTSALLGESPTINASASGENSSASVNYKSEVGQNPEVDYLKKMVEDLRAQLKEEKTRSAQYWEMIQKLMK